MIIISHGVLTIQECKAPRPVHPTPQDTRDSSPFVLLPRSHTLPFSAQPIWLPKDRVLLWPMQWPRFHGKSQLNRPQARTLGYLETELQGFPELLSACPWPGASSHRCIPCWSV